MTRQTNIEPSPASDLLGSWTRTAPDEGHWWMYDRYELPFGCVVLMHHDSVHLWVYAPGFLPRLASSFRDAFWWTESLTRPALPNDQLSDRP